MRKTSIVRKKQAAAVSNIANMNSNVIVLISKLILIDYMTEVLGDIKPALFDSASLNLPHLSIEALEASSEGFIKF